MTELQQGSRATDLTLVRHVRFAASLQGEGSVEKSHTCVRGWLGPLLALIHAGENKHDYRLGDTYEVTWSRFMICLRWAFTVFSLISSLCAISLLGLPRPISSST